MQHKIAILGRLSHHCMEINIQGNNQINTGKIPDRTTEQVEMQQVCRCSINTTVMTLMVHFTITTGKRNGNIRSGNIKINVKNKRPVNIIDPIF